MQTRLLRQSIQSFRRYSTLPPPPTPPTETVVTPSPKVPRRSPLTTFAIVVGAGLATAFVVSRPEVKEWIQKREGYRPDPNTPLGQLVKQKEEEQKLHRMLDHIYDIQSLEKIQKAKQEKEFLIKEIEEKVIEKPQEKTETELPKSLDVEKPKEKNETELPKPVQPVEEKEKLPAKILIEVKDKDHPKTDAVVEIIPTPAQQQPTPAQQHPPPVETGKEKDVKVDVESAETKVTVTVLKTPEEVEVAIAQVRKELTEQFNRQLAAITESAQSKEKNFESEYKKKADELVEIKRKEFEKQLESHIREVKTKYSLDAKYRQDKLISFQKELETLVKSPKLKSDPRVLTARHLHNLRLQLALRDIDHVLLYPQRRGDNPTTNEIILLQRAWATLAEQDDPVITTAIQSVPSSIVDSQISDISTLTSSFDYVETSVYRNIYSVDHPSIWGAMFATVFTFLTLRQRELVNGENDRSRISRAGYYLEHGKLLLCLNELETLSENSKHSYELQSFFKKLQDRLILEQAIHIVKGRAALLALANQ